MVFSIEETLLKLQTYKEASFPILSVYLNIAKEESLGDEKTLDKFNNIIQTSLRIDQQILVEQDLIYMRAFLHTYENKPSIKGIALFSGHSNLWEVVTTPFELPDQVMIDYIPYLLPIIKMLEQYKRYLVIVADREKAKFFTLYQGHIEDQQEVKDPSVHQHAIGHTAGERQNKVERHIQDHLHRHFQLIAQTVHDFAKTKHISGVIVGGHKELMHKLEEHLPQPLQKKIIGEFVSELNTNFNDIVYKSKRVLEQVDKRFHLPQTANPSAL